jgi:hypothetical protein
LPKNASGSTPACLRIARNVPSGISPGAIGEGGIAVGLGVEPDFMGAGRLAVELEAQALEPFDDLAIAETRQPSDQALTING